MSSSSFFNTRLDIAGFRTPVGLDLLLTTLLVAAVVRLGVDFTMGPEKFSTLRLGNGVMLGVLLSVPRNYWPAYLAAGFLGSMAAAIHLDDDMRGFEITLLIACVVTLECYLCARMLRPFLKQLSNSGVSKFLVTFVMIALVAAPLGGAAAMAMALAAIDNQAFWTVFWEWLISSSLGMAMTAPLMLVARQADMGEFIQQRLDRKALGILAATVLATCIIFFFVDVPVSFIVLPLTALAALHAGLVGAVIANFLVAMIVTMATIAGHGPFSVSSDAIVNLRLAQAFIFVSILISLAIAISLTAHRRAARSSQILADDLKRQMLIDKITALPNRYALEKEMEIHWAPTSKTSKNLSLALISIANLDDLWGDGSRSAREQRIAGLSNDLRLFVRNTDMLARFSESEFALLMPGSDQQVALDTVRALANGIGSFNLGALTKPAVNIGVGTVQPRQGRHAGDLLELADQALLTSKRKSGNSIEWRGESLL